MKISIRLDEDRGRKLELLCQATQASRTAVVQRAIDLYFEQVVRASAKAAQILREKGFIGSAEGDPDLSGRYKELLAEGWAAKYGDRW